MKWYIKDGTFSREASADAQVFEAADDALHITIPDGVTVIADSAFRDHPTLQSVTIPDGVTEIGCSAFNSCYELQRVTLPDSVISIGDSAFSGGFSLREVNLGNGVQRIGRKAFMGCDALETLNLPDSVTDIGESAFFFCSALYRITVGGRPINIGRSAFAFTFILIEIRFRDAWNAPFVTEVTKGRLNSLVYITSDFEHIPEEFRMLSILGFLTNAAEFSPSEQMKGFLYILPYCLPSDRDVTPQEVPQYFADYVRTEIYPGNPEAVEDILNNFRPIMDIFCE